MKEIYEKLKIRQEKLLQIKKEKEKTLSKAPEGTLHICSSGGRTQYYQRKDKKDRSGIYIPKKNIHIARALAQKDYDKKVLSAAEKELKVISEYMADYPVINVEKVYESLHRERQKLIIPVMETDELFIENWESITYHGKEFYEDVPEYYTAKGERVRSKSEVIIADTLNREGIPYRYEFPIYISGIGNFYPDFIVLNVRMRKEMFWEHLGMMDDSDYLENAIQKIAKYEQNGLFVGDKLILTYETRKNPINQKQIKNLIYHYLL